MKEVRETTTASMTTGSVSHPTKLNGWFVAVRDVKNSHPGNKLWGDGWEWSWVDADKPLHRTSTDYHNDCLGCHEPAKATDWMYTPATQHFTLKRPASTITCGDIDFSAPRLSSVDRRASVETEGTFNT